MDTVSAYEAAGFSCNVGPVTFSNIHVNAAPTGSGTMSLTDFVPFTTVFGGQTEWGLTLTYSAKTGTTAGSTADVSWTYMVSGTPNLLTDAYASFAGTTTGPGTASLAEVLSNGSTPTLSSPGAVSA
jgi:hypothetical protein